MIAVLLRIYKVLKAIPGKKQRYSVTHDLHKKERINATNAIIDFIFLAVALYNSSFNLNFLYAWQALFFLPKNKTNDCYYHG